MNQIIPDDFIKVERAKMDAKLRFWILNRDKFTCQYCGRSRFHHGDEIELEVDHIEPIAKGGLTTEDNLITSCRDCNQGKGTALVERLASMPKPSGGYTLIDVLMFVAMEISRLIRKRKNQPVTYLAQFPAMSTDNAMHDFVSSTDFYIVGINEQEDFEQGYIDEDGRLTIKYFDGNELDYQEYIKEAGDCIPVPSLNGEQPIDISFTISGFEDEQ